MGWGKEYLYEGLLQHEITAKGGIPPHGPLLVLFSDLGHAFLSALVDLKLNKLGISHRLSKKDFLKRLREGRLSREALLAPKLVLDFTEEKANGEKPYSSVCVFTYLTYETTGLESERFRPKIRWQKEIRISGASPAEIEESSSRFLQKELTALGDSGLISGEIPKKIEPESETYSVHSVDPLHLHGQFSLGLMAGTPALLNLQGGYWGGREFPFTANLSGGYLGYAAQGFQLDAGWAFDNEGDWRQTAGLAAARLIEQYQPVSPLTAGGIPTAVPGMQYNPKTFLGPLYGLAWKSWRLQAGFGLRLGDGTGSALRPLGQIGYALPLGF